MDFFQNWWLEILVLALGGGMATFAPVRKAFKSVIVAGIHALITEDMVKAIILKGLGKYVKKTETKLDDKWLESLKKELDK